MQFGRTRPGSADSAVQDVGRPAGSGNLSDEAALSVYAGTPVRVFDPYAPGVVRDFAEFLETVPMRNNRSLPERAAGETRSALEMVCAAARRPDPTYFVATYFEKTAIAPHPAGRRAALAAQYGETLYPQAISPVFASHAGAGVPAMLSAATGLAPAYFESSAGSRDRFHSLFLLTEASHCGFLARCQGDEPWLAGIDTVDDLRTVIEAIGDFEGLAAFRSLVHEEAIEADILEAARMVAMFLNDRTSAYTCIPALAIAFEKYGIDGGSRRLPQILDDVTDVRAAFRELLRDLWHEPAGTTGLRNLASVLTTRLRERQPLCGARSSLQTELLSCFPAAVAVLLGTSPAANRHTPPRRQSATRLMTLPGVAVA